MALNHEVQGSVNYTVVGSPTIVDGVASGFSSGNYLQLASLSNGFTCVESFCKFTTGSVNVQQGIMGTSTSWSRYGFFIDVDGKLNTGVVIDGDVRKTLKTAFALQPNTTYYAKMNASVSTHTLALQVSTDRTNWSLNTLDLGEFTRFLGGTIRIGQTQHGAFNGSIGLNNTYIKINGQAWFGKCPVEVKHISLNSTSVNYLVKDGKLVFADSKLYIEESGVKTYATADLAPVPSGYTYGTTTTTAIGWVDMGTQQFTEAPAGAILGKDE